MELSPGAIQAYSAVWVAVNLITFCMFGYDKRQARLGRGRIPERRLLGWSFSFGAFGGWIGMFFFHHKTRKPSFFVPMALAGALQGVIAWWFVSQWLVSQN